MSSILQNIELPSELYERLKQIALRQQRSIEEILVEAAEDYVDLEHEDEPDEAIKTGFLEGWHQAKTEENARPIWDVLREIDDETN